MYSLPCPTTTTTTTTRILEGWDDPRMIQGWGYTSRKGRDIVRRVRGKSTGRSEMSERALPRGNFEYLFIRRRRRNSEFLVTRSQRTNTSFVAKRETRNALLSGTFVTANRSLFDDRCHAHNTRVSACGNIERNNDRSGV